MNIGIQVFVSVPVFKFGCIPRNENTRSHGNNTFNFKEMPNCTIVSVLFAITASNVPEFQLLHILRYFLFTVAILVGMRWYLMVSICIFLMTNNVEHLFMCLLAIYISSLEQGLFKSFSQFKVWGVCCWDRRVLNVVLMLNYYQVYDLQIFSLIL